MRLPLFYKSPVVLRFDDHGEAGLTTNPSFGFASEAIAIPLCIGEFAVALRHYPIVFGMEDDAPPIALVGIRQNNNLFVTREGNWHLGAYVPAYLRRYPFIVTEIQDETRQFLGIDRESDRFIASASTDQTAARLFDDEGRPTATVQSAIAFCRAYHDGYTITVAFGRALAASRLLKPYHAQFRLPDGALHRVNGFQSVDDKALRSLPTETIADWHSRGWLDLATQHLASLQNFQNLLDLNAQRANERKALA